MRLTRRDALAAAGGSAALLLPTASAATPDTPADYRRGLDQQRIADLGDGRFLNPVLSGDRPDPAILKDGQDYYLTFSSFDSYPGLILWHSRDLVNWRPIGPALHRTIGSVWAVSLAKHPAGPGGVREERPPADAADGLGLSAF
ncbi:family 43 glycosylhydrolase, partial [Sphingomonas sp. DC1200-1]|uniref:family 43 glycosylhydrolase n=1 Tax=Sphingomonas sp. DC1200-1 TaxID=2804660 RepID=UPI003CEC7164